MRLSRETGAAILLTTSLVGCTSATTPEQAPSLSATPEVTPSPIPEVTPSPIPEFSLSEVACSNEIAANSLTPPESEALMASIAEYEELSPNELENLALDGITTLNYVSATADKAVEPGIVDGPNPNQNDFGFFYQLNQDTGAVVIEDWNISDGQDCIVSSVARKFTGSTDAYTATTESITVALGQDRYEFILDAEMYTVSSGDGKELTPDAVATLQVVASRHSNAISELEKMGLPFFPEPETYIDQPDIVFPSEI